MSGSKGSDVDRFLANLETSSDVELSSSNSAAVAAATSTPMSAVKSTMKSKGKVDFRLPETGPRRSARLSKLVGATPKRSLRWEFRLMRCLFSIERSQANGNTIFDL